MAFGLLGLFVGVLMMVFGGFMIGLFPGYTTDRNAPGHQPLDFSISGIFIGFMCLLIGVLLIIF